MMCKYDVWPSLFFFFNDTATTEIYTLSLHDALPISGRSPPPASPTAPARTGSPARDPAAVARAGAAPRRSAAPRRRRARARASRLAVLLRGGLGGGRRRLVGQPRLHRARALARPVAQRRVRAAMGHGLVRRQGGLPFLLLLARQAESGERAEPDAALDLGHRADRLEGLGGGAEALLLELGLADEEPGLGLHGVEIGRASC